MAKKIDFWQKVWDTVLALRKKGWALHIRQAVCHTTQKGVMVMPITLTVHIGKFTITITVKSGNRHSGK